MGRRIRLTSRLWLGSALSSLLAVSGCTSEDPEIQAVLNQAAFVEGTTYYEFGHDSILEIPVVGGPSDVDLGRWAMLHDGSRYRLYFFKSGSNDTLYQYAYNPATTQYEYGFDSIETLRLVGVPPDADSRSFAMLHDGGTYRLYMKSNADPDQIHQFGYSPASQQYEYGFDSIPMISVAGFPADAVPGQWAMLHDAGGYRLYRMAAAGQPLYQSAYDAGTQTYEYGFDSIPELTLQKIPASSDTSSFAMLHDGGNFRFYFLE